ncbi:hypothetical protein NA57DRAFT_10917, partial [Rhizodiscina lignyota]
SLLALVAAVNAHTASFNKGMYCLNGNDTANPNLNSNEPVNPLWNLTKTDWWWQHDRGCDKVPPAAGEYLEIPAGGNFTVEMAHNQAFTTLSYGGSKVTEWPDGGQHPEDWHGTGGGEDCIQDDGAMHTQNQTAAAGTAFAISYNSNLEDVTIDNLVVFTVLEHTPWHRIATYQVPKNMPACPADGCHCAWLWLPRGCGQPNMYMQGHKCMVTGATSTVPISTPAKPPVYCGDDETKCVTGSKQMAAWNQLDGNNVTPPPGISPCYDATMGYKTGPQDDIF